MLQAHASIKPGQDKAGQNRPISCRYAAAANFWNRMGGSPPPRTRESPFKDQESVPRRSARWQSGYAATPRSHYPAMVHKLKGLGSYWTNYAA